MNRLAREKSPYLLQHATNPVDWYPWGEEAFGKARTEQKPIFLSVGYSTCHWCHVMERESFEKDEVAAALNRDFVPVKVDREERPDVDRVYMTFVQATTGSGGWPMSVWLTPDLEPFYGGTYFPPESRGGRPGFVDILGEIARLWREERGALRQQAAALTARLRAAADRAPRGSRPGPAVLDRAVEEFGRAFDRRSGGFGGAPKFPRPSELLLLLREHARTGNRSALDMVVATLQAMAHGGIRDHLGGGFHRYSVDAMWRVPHFEKMLYDQAQLVLAYLEAGQASGIAEFLDVAAETLRYVQRDLTDARGGFYSAEDADSLPPETRPAAPGGAPPPSSDPALARAERGPASENRGVRSETVAPAPPHGADRAQAEGAFYVWTDGEIGELLGAEADLVRQRFGIRPEGNAPHDPHGEFAGRNLLYVARGIDDLAADAGRSPGEVAAALDRTRLMLFEARSARPRPHLDDKVLTAWNGLMIAAFARAARAFAPVPGHRAFAPGCLASARAAARFIHEVMWAPYGTLRRSYRDGEASIDGYAEDYALLVFGLLELFQSDGDPHWLEWALALQARQDDLFLDRSAGGWFSTTGTDPSVLLRLKEDYDGAEPSATSVSAWNVQTFAHLSGDGRWTDTLERAFRHFSRPLTEMPRAVPMMLAALSIHEAGLGQAVIVGRSGQPDTAELSGALERRYRPFAVRIPVDPAVQPALARLLPFIAQMPMRDGRATAYVCRNFTCHAPTTDAGEMERQLEGLRAEQ